MLDHLDHITDDAARFVDAARTAGLEARVPSCPGWSVRDVVAHLGAVHRDKERIVRDRHSKRRENRPPPQVRDDELIPWFAEGLAMLLSTLAATDPGTPVWTWYEGDQTAGFWRRRMAHETLIHRVDAELAVGSVSAIDGAFAADGVDEIVVAFLGSPPTWGRAIPAAGVVRLATPDRAWMLRKARFSGTSPHTGTSYEDVDAAVLVEIDQPDCTISGTSADLDLWLWGRGPLEALRVSGNGDLAAWLRRFAVEETQ